MDDRERIERVIDTIVRDARLASTRERDDLRRELESHFADASAAMDTPHSAIERFGNPDDVGRLLEDAHRRRRGLARIARIAVVFVASATLTLALQFAVNLGLGAGSGAIASRPAFLLSVAFSTFIIVALIAAWELDIEPLCARLERHPLRLVLMLVGLVTAMLLVHASHNTVLPLAPAFVASAVNVAIWTSTVAILAHMDRAFTKVFARQHP